jgi:hypothetical protein
MATYVEERSGNRYPALWNDSGYDWWIVVCNACQQPVLVFAKGARIFPTPLPKPSHERIPEKLRKDLDEAKMCFASSCFRGCAVLARRVVQVACVEKGAKKDKLVDQIEELRTNGVITKDIEEWAHVVRWIGNDAAHPDHQEVTSDDARGCLDLAEQFLHVIFVTPAIAQVRRAARGK